MAREATLPAPSERSRCSEAGQCPEPLFGFLSPVRVEGVYAARSADFCVKYPSDAKIPHLFTVSCHKIEMTVGNCLTLPGAPESLNNVLSNLVTALA